MNQSNQIFTEPLDCIGVLRKSLSIMKNNALKFICLMLLFYVPMLVLALAIIQNSPANLDDSPFQGANLLMLLITILLDFTFMAVTVITAKNCLQNIPISIGNILRQACVKLLSIVVTSLLFGVLFGLLMAFGMLLGMVLPVTVIIPLTMLACLYFLIRFCFFLPPILWNDRFIGLSDSWRLTKNNFWWLVGLSILDWIIIGIVAIIVLLPLMMISPISYQDILSNPLAMTTDFVIINIIIALINGITNIFSLIVYTVAYFNLHVRNEAAGRTSAICV